MCVCNVMNRTFVRLNCRHFFPHLRGRYMLFPFFPQIALRLRGKWSIFFRIIYHYCSHEIKRRLLLGRKVMTNLDSILKSRDITLPTKVHLVKAVVFPVVMYGCESWTVKKAERRRIDAFELWCWRRLLAVQRTLKSLFQHHSPKASILLRSAFFIAQLSHPYMTTGKTIALSRWTFLD